MAYSATALRPFGFSQPTRITLKTETRAGTPIPSDDSLRSLRASNTYRTSRSHRTSLSEDFSPSHKHSLPSYPTSEQPRAATQHRSSAVSHGTFPDEEEDIVDTAMSSSAARHSGTREKRKRQHPARLQSCTQYSSIASPTSFHTLADVSPSDLPVIREDFSQKQLQEQLKEIYSALRRVEDEREKVLSQMKRGRADQCRVERELEETRRENERLAARLEEMLRSSKLKSPLSARSDDHGWGCSMYDMEASEGY